MENLLIDTTKDYISWLENNENDNVGITNWIKILTDILFLENDIPYFAEKIKKCFGGMGSLNDLFFDDKYGKYDEEKMTIYREYNKKIYALAVEVLKKYA